MNKNEKILISGSSGMAGSAIVRRLLSLGYTNLLGTYHSHKPDAGRADMPEGGLRLVQADLTRQDAVGRLFEAERPDHVFLAAARVGGIQANNTYPADFIYDNLIIQANIIHAAYRSGVKRLLFLGSSCIYPKLAPQPMREEHLLTGLLEPTNEPYAIAKIAGIKMCESYNRQYGTHFMAVMPTNLYGTNDNFDLEKSHVLPALIRKFHLAKLAAERDWAGIQKDEARFGPIPSDIKVSLGLSVRQCSTAQQLNSSSAKLGSPFTVHRSRSVPIWGTGAPRREFLHVDDMADACVFVMNLDEKIATEQLLNYPRPCFVNVGCGTDATIRELAETVKDVVGFDGGIDFDTTKPDGTPQKLLDVSRLSQLGWQASIGLAEGIKKTYEWYKDQQK